MSTEKSTEWKKWLSFGAAMALGLILLVAGIGKLLAQSEFAGVLLVQTFLPENLANLVGRTVPVAEVIIGGLLVIGFFPKLMAVLSLPLSLAFMGNNIWLLTLGLDCPKCPHCFGKLEELWGVMSTWNALYLDIAMVVLAALVIAFFSSGFFPFRLWFRELKSGKAQTK